MKSKYISFYLISVLFSFHASAQEEMATRILGNIEVQSPASLIPRIEGLLRQAEATKVGHALLEEIRGSKNKLLIRQNKKALSMAGKTLLPLTKALRTPGEGVDAVLEMDFRLPDEGSHEVLSCVTNRHIPFTALMNFVHELRHARDGMTGNFKPYSHEFDAADSENQLRREMNLPEEHTRCMRNDEENGWQIWFPED